MKLFLICGKADSGKNFFGNILKEEFEKKEYKVCMLRLTEPLYNYAIKYFSWDGSEKNKPRSLLQNLGCELIKEKLGLKEFLINRLREDITILDEFFDVGIITDGRLIYEFDKLKEYYPHLKIIKMERDIENNLQPLEKKHITETDLDNSYNYDYVVKNTDIETLKTKSSEIFKKEKYFEIAIDGPSSTGKSTVSKIVAKNLSFMYIDTGSMYRALSLYFINNNLDYNDEDVVNDNLSNIDVKIKFSLNGQKVFLNNSDVTHLIRTEEISKVSSIISTYKNVREKMVMLQKRMSKTNNVIMDGRDIGSVVMPYADLKIYLDADKNIRIERRYKEYKEKGVDISFEQVKKQLEERDKRDKERENSPLVKCKDASVIDTTNLTIDETVKEIIKLYEEKRK